MQVLLVQKQCTIVAIKRGQRTVVVLCRAALEQTTHFQAHYTNQSGLEEWCVRDLFELDEIVAVSVYLLALDGRATALDGRATHYSTRRLVVCSVVDAKE
jgi:hypothetical protein